ncbi:hypothetical protein [Mucilaginibacter sp.]|uniref:hypothetical protein n=1 Tax=Mucilaginibacter sp. TaxID=1882438 RepID=UPI003B008534
MIKSKYILDILDLLLDGDIEGVAVRPQLQFLTDTEYDYTCSGLFVKFSHLDEIIKYKYYMDNLVLLGVIITTSEYPIEADGTLFLKNGIIDYLEIWCYKGDYPKKDLTKYTLIQAWNNSPAKQITTE